MTSLLDIGKSALLAYRTALTTTGENIANANVEGYTRRDAVITEVLGGQMTPISQNSGGQGVIVEDVRRSFDAFLSERVRNTSSAYESSDTFHTITTAIEDLFLPSVGGIASGLDGFFSSLSTLSGNPSDYALRQGALEAARAMATSISDVATGLMALRADVVVQAETATDMLNEKLQSLAELQRGMTGAVAANGGLNPVYDERDRLLQDISEIVGTKVVYDTQGRVEVHLGETQGGPLLMGLKDAADIGIKTDTDLRLTLTRDGTTTESSQLSGGSLQGYRNALAAIDDAVTQLNAFAVRIANDVNTLHSTGLDMNGDFGGDLFTLEGWQSVAMTTNRGSTFIDFTVSDPDVAADLGTFTIARDTVAGEWIATDSLGTEIGRGSSVLTFPGLTMTMSGTPANGDRYTISPVSGRAIDMTMRLTDPEQLAAAAANLVAPLATNTGTGSAVMARVPVSEPAVDDLSVALPVTGTGADAANLLTSGVVGYVPAGSKSLSLASLGQQALADFVMSDAQAASATSLSFTVGGNTHTFDLTSLSATSAADVASALNSGSLLSATGLTLAEAGAHAAGVSGSFTLAASQGNFTAATFSSGAGGSAGALTNAEAAGGTIQIFTRNGVQIAGTPLDAASAAALLTEANGFFEGATYIDEYLYPAGSTGYRGIGLSQETVPGAQVIDLPLGGVQTWDAATGTRPTLAATTLTVAYVAGQDQSFDLPAGNTAARIAARLAEDVEGLNVDADTSVGFSISGTGNVSFKLEGANVEPVQITGYVSAGRLDSIASAINARTGVTGISASLSQDGTRIVLNQPDGENIAVTNFTNTGGTTMDFDSVARDGLSTGPLMSLGAGADSAVFTGTLRFEAPAAFGVGYGASTYSSTVDPEAGGLVERTYGAAGTVQNFTFTTNADFDGGASSVDGLTAQAASSTFTMTVEGVTVSYTGTDPAAGLASALRQEAPESTMLGAAVGSLPATGAATSVMLGDDTYVLRMTATGDISVTGPEEGRISAEFDTSNRLVLTVKDGTLDGAALRVVAGTSGAAAFGIASTSGATSTLTGRAMDPSGLPSTMDIEVAGTMYTVGVSTGGATLPGGFPGTTSISGGIISFDFGSSVGPVRIPPSAGATAAGFATLGAEASVDGDTLTLTATDGTVVDADISVSALASQRITLDNLPEEDLIIVMTGSGTMRLGGNYEAGELSGYSPSVKVEVVDAAAKLVRLVDDATGDTIAERTLDASNAAVFGNVQFALSGSPDDGDTFVMTANSGFVGDGRNINDMAALRNADPTTGKGGFGRILAALQAQKGALVSAAANRVAVNDANRESAERTYADRTAVDLDEQAAKLIDQQQAYQASARILTVATELFDTLLQSL